MDESELRGPLVQYNIYYQRTKSTKPQRASVKLDGQGKRHGILAPGMYRQIIRKEGHRGAFSLLLLFLPELGQLHPVHPTFI